MNKKKKIIISCLILLLIGALFYFMNIYSTVAADIKLRGSSSPPLTEKSKSRNRRHQTILPTKVRYRIQLLPFRQDTRSLSIKNIKNYMSFINQANTPRSSKRFVPPVKTPVPKGLREMQKPPMEFSSPPESWKTRDLRKRTVHWPLRWIIRLCPINEQAKTAIISGFTEPPSHCFRNNPTVVSC